MGKNTFSTHLAEYLTEYTHTEDISPYHTILYHAIPGMDDGEVPLEGYGHRGPDGAVEGDLHQGQCPGHQVRVHPDLQQDIKLGVKYCL